MTAKKQTAAAKTSAAHAPRSSKRAADPAAPAVTPAQVSEAARTQAATQAAAMAAATQPSPRLDKTRPGGYYLREDGRAQDANGNLIEE